MMNFARGIEFLAKHQKNIKYVAKIRYAVVVHFSKTMGWRNSEMANSFARAFTED